MIVNNFNSTKITTLKGYIKIVNNINGIDLIIGNFIKLLIKKLNPLNIFIHSLLP